MKKKILVLLLPFAGFTVCYIFSRFFLNFFFGIHYMCPIKMVTGWLCPGCGATRALSALLRLDIAESVRYNPVIILMTAALVLCYMQLLLNTFSQGKKIIPDRKAFYFVLSGIIMCYYVVRNFVPFLQP